MSGRRDFNVRIAIMGAGGQGCFFGACLAKSGNDVVFIGRGANLDALRKNGIKVKSKELGDFSLPVVQATGEPEKVGQVDLVLFCVKTYDLDSAAQKMRPLVGPDTLIIPVLNGIDVAERIAGVVGAEHVLGAISWVNAAVESPGVVFHGGSTTLIFGDVSGKAARSDGDTRVTEILRVLHEAGLQNAALSQKISEVLWEKFVAVTAANGVFALVRLPLGPLRECPEAWEMLRMAMEEDAAVAKAKGFAIAPDYLAKVLQSFAGYSPGTRPSMLVDLEAGRRLELEALTGTVVRMGRELGVETPISRTIYGALKPYENGPPTRPSKP